MIRGWDERIRQAGRSDGPVRVPKDEVGPVPGNFETVVDAGPVYRLYRRKDIIQVVEIQEFLGVYRVTCHPQQESPSIWPEETTSTQVGCRSRQLDIWDLIKLIGLFVVGLFAAQKILGGPKHGRYKLFISHSWGYEDQFQRLKRLLRESSGIEFHDHSVPSDDPLDTTTDAELRQELRNKIKQTSAVVIISGMYTSYSDWIQREIEIAKELGKPIIGVRPRGNEQVPRLVKEAADEIVGWTSESVAAAVHRQVQKKTATTPT